MSNNELVSKLVKTTEYFVFTVYHHFPVTNPLALNDFTLQRQFTAKVHAIPGKYRVKFPWGGITKKKKGIKFAHKTAALSCRLDNVLLIPDSGGKYFKKVSIFIFYTRFII